MHGATGLARKAIVRLRSCLHENSVAEGGDPDGESEIQSEGQSRTAQRQVGRQAPDQKLILCLMRRQFLRGLGTNVATLLVVWAGKRYWRPKSVQHARVISWHRAANVHDHSTGVG